MVAIPAKIIMPPAGQTTDEVLLVKWHKKIGEEVRKGDVLFEIETDKAIMEIESYEEGILLSIDFNEGEYVNVGSVVAYVGDRNEHIPEADNKMRVQKEEEYRTELKKPDDLYIGGVSKVIASPAARYAAKCGNVKIEDIAENIKKPVKKNDVLNYIEKNRFVNENEFYFIDTTPMRKAIAKRTVESITSVPQFTISMDIDMTECIRLRQDIDNYLKESDIKVSFNDIIIKCVSKAIEKYPYINSTYHEDKIKVYKNVNFGLAVSIDEGLTVPVVKQANKKTISQIASENINNIEKAKNNKLHPDDIKGGTITLSNLGMFNVDRFTAIINQPESCILAIGRICEKPVCMDGQVLSRNMMTLTASFDHRVIDGAAGAAFLDYVKTLLEYPNFLLLF